MGVRGWEGDFPEGETRLSSRPKGMTLRGGKDPKRVRGNLPSVDPSRSGRPLNAAAVPGLLLVLVLLARATSDAGQTSVSGGSISHQSSNLRDKLPRWSRSRETRGDGVLPAN